MSGKNTFTSRQKELIHELTEIEKASIKELYRKGNRVNIRPRVRLMSEQEIKLLMSRGAK